MGALVELSKTGKPASLQAAPARSTCARLATLWVSSALLLAACASPPPTDEVPPDFVELSSFAPDIVLDVRYAGSDNFLGRPVAGYLAEKVYLARPAAAALVRVQQALRPFGLGLKVFDAYRPQRAVDDFVRWAEDLDDRRMQSRYYPRVDKANLFAEGYIAARSGHSRGATVDLTLVDLTSGEELDMGTPWDFFDPLSWPSSMAVGRQQRANRMLLQALMLAQGFVPLTEEWWHFGYRPEPYPETYFNFPVQ